MSLFQTTPTTKKKARKIIKYNKKRPAYFRCEIQKFTRNPKHVNSTNSHKPNWWKAARKKKHGADIAYKLAYISGEKLVSKHDGCTRSSDKDPARIKRVYTYGYDGKTMLADATQDDLQDIVNKLDPLENRANSVLYREITISLPMYSNESQNHLVATDFCRQLSKRYKTCPVVAEHVDEHNEQPHLHIFLPMREWDAKTKEFGKKIRVLEDKKTGVKEQDLIRKMAAESVNKAKEKYRNSLIDPRPVSHLSYKDQGLKIMAKKSVKTKNPKEIAKVKEYNKAIDKHNKMVDVSDSLDRKISNRMSAKIPTVFKTGKVANGKRAMVDISKAKNLLKGMQAAADDPEKFVKTQTFSALKKVGKDKAKELITKQLFGGLKGTSGLKNVAMIAANPVAGTIKLAASLVIEKVIDTAFDLDSKKEKQAKEKPKYTPSDDIKSQIDSYKWVDTDDKSGFGEINIDLPGKNI